MHSPLRSSLFCFKRLYLLFSKRNCASQLLIDCSFAGRDAMDRRRRSRASTSACSDASSHRLGRVRTQPLSRTTSAKSGATLRKEITHFRMVTQQGALNNAIRKHHYDGSGTEADPYAVEWLSHDPGNPQNWTQLRKWLLTMMVAIATLSVAFCSSAYSGSIGDEMKDLGCSAEVAVLGTSLFVLGFAVGPMLWAPLSEGTSPPSILLLIRILANVSSTSCWKTGSLRDVLWLPNALVRCRGRV